MPKILGLAGVPAVGVPKGSSTCQRTSTRGQSPWTGLKWLVVLRGSSRVPFSLLFVFLSRVSFLLLLKSVLVCCFVFFHLLICCSSLFHARSSLHPSSGIPLLFWFVYQGERSPYGRRLKWMLISSRLSVLLVYVLVLASLLDFRFSFFFTFICLKN